jgi:phytanoyl-CoA hydroxylase
MFPSYEKDGFYIARSLFDSAEVAQLTRHYMAMHDEAAPELKQTLGDNATMTQDDPLRSWPRLMQMHRRDPLSLNWLLDARLRLHLTELLGREPFAVQTMMYFKPPGARGQALHQDQFYLRVQPGTCMAAWLALDDCDDENGCIQLVHGSHTWPVLCTVDADTTRSFTDVTVDLPAGVSAKPVHMRAGDVLFFNGQIVHGSSPNTSPTRFRRALIGHYIAGDAEQVYQWYKPALRMDGSEVELATSEIGGQCGTWVERGDQSELVLAPEPYNAKVFGPH